MIDKVEEIFKKRNVMFHKNQGISVANVASSSIGIDLAKEILYSVVDKKTVLYLSGGSLKSLYEILAREELLIPGAVGLVDERYGEPMHGDSNQFTIRGTGLLRYLEIRDIPFYPILQGQPRVETADNYDQKIRELNAIFPKSIALLGIGPDGHTSGIAPNRKDFRNPIFEKERRSLLVSEFNDITGKFKERVTTTFLGLEMQDLLIVLAFGENKKEAFDLMFENGKEEEIPARFYTRPEIAKKTLLITDQKV